jgi:hypothetical protein
MFAVVPGGTSTCRMRMSAFEPDGKDVVLRPPVTESVIIRRVDIDYRPLANSLCFIECTVELDFRH